MSHAIRDQRPSFDSTTHAHAHPVGHPSLAPSTTSLPDSIRTLREPLHLDTQTPLLPPGDRHALTEANPNALSAPARPKTSTARPRLYKTPSSDPNLTPKERLNALLSSGTNSTASPPGHSLSTAGGPRPSRQPATNEARPPPPPPPPSSSNMNVAAQRPISPPVLHPAAANAAQTVAARNSSMDSALSSISSASANASQPSTTTTHSIRSSQDTAVPKSHTSSTPAQTYSNAPTPSPDAAALIDGSGGSEATIQKLLRDAKKTNDKNEQLWKLVEKQRAMILGLNKDLEKALKEKERYRRKYKEAVASGTATPEPEHSHAHAGSVASSIASRVVPSHAHVASTETLASAGTFIDSTSSPARGHSKLSESVSTSDLAPAPPQQLSSYGSATPRATTETALEVETAAPLSPKTPQESTHQKKPSISSPGEKARKAAPAPLNLSQAQASNPLFNPVDDADDQSESDYEGPRPEDFGRGRRRTRMADDAYREAVAVEEERRSRSNKSSKSKSKGKKAADDQQSTAPPAPLHATPTSVTPAQSKEQQRDLPAGFGGLPTSPRAAALGGLQSPLQASMGSIASQLHPPPPPPPPPPAEPQYAQMPIPSVSLPAKSPGLPMSPRPGDRPMNSPMPRAPVNGLASPGPLSPRGGGGLPLSPRAPRGPLPLPQNHALAAQSPHFARAGQYPDPATQASSMAEILQQTQSHQSDKDDPASPVEEPIGQIFRGFVSDDHPKLLLPPNALPLIYAKVHSSRLRPSRSTHGNASKNSDDDQIFTLAVHSRSDNAQLWRVEKTTAAFGMLDQTLRASGALKGKTFDRSIFSGHSPAKIDARRAALDEYFESILDTDMDSKSAEVLCHFFSSNTIGPRLATLTSPPDTNDGIQAVSGPTSRPKKEGYLAKKGKQFGGWKARYFVLDERLLHYFEAPNVGQLGTIKLTNAQIARQNAKEAEEDAEFRHAFMILEPKRRDSSSLVRHVLCAESDAERDEWVEVLMQHVGTTLPLSAIPPPSQGIAPVRTGSRRGKEPSDNSLQTVSYEETVQADTPVVGSRANGDSPSSASLTEVSTSTSVQQKPISGPVGGGPIQNVAAWGNKSIPSPTTLSKEHKKRSMFGFINRGSEDNSGLNKPARSRSRSKMSHTPLRPVFGLALAEAAEYFAPEGIDICLPAPIYRCIEYLEAKNASSEEGIFRLSGSNTVVKGLKEKFNAEGDVKLVEGPYYDIHAIASLLKLYLRELPESILTRELHLDFLRVLETEDKQSRIAAFNVLVHRLPEANLELLATLSRFLIDIVNHSDVNLMSVRNVGIVFSPTLNIPAPLISLLLSDYDSIFAEPDTMSASAASPVLEDLASAAQDSPMDLRSPRKQMFQELPTPGLKSPQFQSMMSPGFPRPKGDFRGNYDTGFVPMQPSYESRQAPQPVAQVSQDGYGSLNAALAPATSMSTSSRPFPSSSNQAAASRSQSDSTDPIAQTYEDLAGPPKVSNVITTNLPAEVATHRRGRRESALLGGSALSSSPSGTSGSLDARRKSSYQRLREMAGLRE